MDDWVLENIYLEWKSDVAEAYKAMRNLRPMISKGLVCEMFGRDAPNACLYREIHTLSFTVRHEEKQGRDREDVALNII